MDITMTSRIVTNVCFAKISIVVSFFGPCRIIVYSGSVLPVCDVDVMSFHILNPFEIPSVVMLVSTSSKSYNVHPNMMNFLANSRSVSSSSSSILFLDALDMIRCNPLRFGSFVNGVVCPYLKYFI